MNEDATHRERTYDAAEMRKPLFPDCEGKFKDIPSAGGPTCEEPPRGKTGMAPQSATRTTYTRIAIEPPFMEF